ncbi:DUF6415 family natural product biosynthesis protein [Streptomyces sp. NPDC050164]|uniref:DUF6415 family natural product biosynthesis protein n=1 Tax=Streptomyces sp. NPDC050164 TaxID=3365605 RepID=UPI00379C5679
MRATATKAVPLDLETMRSCADRLLARNAGSLSSEELETLTLQLRGHIMVAVPEVETAALALPEDTVPRACALFCVGEARLRLSSEPGRHLSAHIAHAQRLARSVRVLCDHYENGDHQCPSGPERAAYLRMLQHCPACPACRAVNEEGKAVGVCATGERLYEEFRQARRDSAAP